MSNSATNGSPSSFAKVLAVVGALLYTVSPIDLLPDVILVLGWLDDLAVIGATIAYVRSSGSVEHGTTGFPKSQPPKALEGASTKERPQ
jgi:uncharacterized membrane protein YkvA (DUF1232 family)